MLATNIAKVSLTKIQYYFTKTSLVQMRTLAVGIKTKMRLFIIGDAALYDIAVATAKTRIFLKSRFINANLPTDTAAVFTLVGYTLKIFVIFRLTEGFFLLMLRQQIFLSLLLPRPLMPYPDMVNFPHLPPMVIVPLN